jgi:hypothetical protein
LSTPLRYNWNSVESGVKHHHKPKLLKDGEGYKIVWRQTHKRDNCTLAVLCNKNVDFKFSAFLEQPSSGDAQNLNIGKTNNSKV